ncbi:MAG: toll/interleukin-1 receptor domain-containing protein [Burkholderiales bacterium]
MQVFLSYASEDRGTAEEIELALRGAGHSVFFDRESLPPGGEFHARIRDAVRRCDAFVFLVTTNSIATGSYARTELKYARERWEFPGERVLPVLLSKVPLDEIPPYLKSVTFLEPEGNTAAEVADAIEAFGRAHAQPDPAPPPPPPPLSPAGAQVALGMPSYLHNIPIASPQGAMPGMQLSVPVTVRGATGRSLQLVVRFMQFNGPLLYANQMERIYRDMTGNAATGTQPRPMTSDAEAFVESQLTIPYYALNFMPTGGMAMHQLAFFVTAYLDQQQVAQSTPVGFSLRF